MRCLETTFLIDFLRDEPAAVEAARGFRGEPVATTEVCVFEVLAGAYRRPVGEDLAEQALRLFDRMEVLPVDRKAAVEAARLAGGLARRGGGAGPIDCLIAGAALSRGYRILVTRDRDFRRIPGIRVEGY